MDIVFAADWELILRVLVALLLGLAIGTQRSLTGSVAGLRTYALVSMGSASFTAVSMYTLSHFGIVDPTRIAANIVVGIGFLGAGVIFAHGRHVTGLTTAAGLWVTASVGLAVGIGFYGLAGAVTALTIITLDPLYYIEKRYVHKEREIEIES